MGAAKKAKARKADTSSPAPERRSIATNRRARHDYEILDTWEAGVVLSGSEVKSLRDGRVSMNESYARAERGDIWLHGLNIGPYAFSREGGHEPTRPRKLLLHRREIETIAQETKEAGLTIVPLKLSFVRGLVKVEIGLGRGKKLYDKRESAKRRDAERDMQKALRRRTRGG